MQGVRKERRKKDLTEQGSHVKEVNFKKGMSLTWKNKEGRPHSCLHQKIMKRISYSLTQ